MKLTKYLHSCLLLEEGGKTILIDPGNYTYDAKVFPLETFKNLDYIFITHEHMDHMHVPFIKELLLKLPNVIISTNSQAVATLAKEGISATTDLPDFATVEVIPHEDVFGIEVPLNSEFTFMNTFTHPGDSFQSTKTARIFALPMQAPWGSLTEAINHVMKLKPEIVVPIHDWHWRDEVRVGLYKKVEEYLKSQNITFIPLETGKVVEL